MYLDTGILVKLLTPEPETTFFERELRGETLVTSELALVEVQSALCAKERGGMITTEQRRHAEAKFQEMIDEGLLELIELNHRVLRKAARTIQSCHPIAPLRSLDAIHVATCDLEQEAPLCSTDERLRKAAVAQQISVFPQSYASKAAT